ncbi:MAG: DNA polymerase III subunit delta' [Candidatus Competibacteraceae bacterium]|nr:DNA polymerase III subunit delta' [Candidatus Competibacteraceae bacterium]MBK7982897.1 DNA polymerase III subunit delta' [Candidatus Competibacteraceae bacterium]MBK8898556.1 DNA polymerase III subunit delta' [Candidatus Competibacteraceae bacterium]MBK8962361.1 DNA polymerase III subunit delta' [Candidatus Competibacteraceae bacterium]MBK9951578.1 DNA polymerase III subunit delta' [Candidatus Competibacteraceae bacterium]
MVERLPWHEPLWGQLQARRAAGRLPHAWLLAGPDGLGKRVFARRLAAALLCEAPEAAGDACMRCRSCRLFQAGSHPDYRAVQPAEDGKAIKVDQIRELSEFLGFTAQYGRCKVALLEPADRLNVNAANSLLKTLEEPPGNSLLVLATSQPARLPATVRSRCQKVRFEPPPVGEALPWLKSRMAAGLEAQILLDVAGGAPLAALALADPRRWNRRRQLIDSYDRVLNGTTDPVRAAETWGQGDLAENLRWLVGWHSDLIRLKMSSEPPRLGNPDLRALLRRWADRWSARELFERLDSAVRLSVLCATAQVNAQLSLEVFFGDGAEGIGSDRSLPSVTEG